MDSKYYGCAMCVGSASAGGGLCTVGIVAQREKYKLCQSPVNCHAVADERIAAAVSLRYAFTIVSSLVMRYGQRQAGDRRDSVASTTAGGSPACGGASGEIFRRALCGRHHAVTVPFPECTGTGQTPSGELHVFARRIVGIGATGWHGLLACQVAQTAALQATVTRFGPAMVCRVLMLLRRLPAPILYVPPIPTYSIEYRPDGVYACAVRIRRKRI
jgi:hypothetical protein